MPFMGIDDDEFSNSDADDDDLLDADLKALSKAFMPSDGDDDEKDSGNLNDDAAANISSMDESDDSDGFNEIDNDEDMKSLDEMCKVMGPFNKTFSALSNIGGVSDDDDDDDDEAIETLRAIQRRFAAYDTSVDAVNRSKVHDHQKSEQVRASSIPLEKETSNNLFVHRTNACEGFPDSEDSCVIPGNIIPISDDVPTTQTMDQIEWDKFNDGQLLSVVPKNPSFPKAAQLFIDAIRKNRSCQKLIRSKLAQIESRIEVNQKLKQRVKILKDFQISCARKSGRALSQKKDSRVQLLTAQKVDPSKHSKGKEHKVCPKNYGPKENSHVVNYRLVLKNYSVSFCRRKWSIAERKAIGKGLRQEYQKTLFDKAVELQSGSEHIDNVTASVKNQEITDENIRLYLQNVDWNYFASIYVKGHSGAECEARWLNYEDPLVNNNPWTHEEDKILRMIVQERGLNDCIDIAVSLGTNRTPFQCLTRYQRSLNPWIMKREWTKDEDAQLCAAVEVIGEGKWQTVASTLEGRTGTQCSNRWKKSLHPAKQKRGKWEPDEDIRLKIAVTILGPKTWRRIACFVPGRTDVQCRERWFNSLNPSLKMSAWTEDEDKRLLEAVEVHEYAWTKVAQSVPPRTDSQCLRRWEALCPDEKPKRQAVRKIKRLALTSNFVDRESERPNLRPEDFVPLLMLNSAADCEKLISSTKSKKKSCEISKEPRLRKPRKNAKTRLKEVSDIASAEVFDPNAESSLLMVEHVPTSDMLPEQQLISLEPSACQPSLTDSQTVDGANAENSSIKKKQGTKRKAAANENAPKTNLNSANRLKRCAEPSAGQSSPLQSQAIDRCPAEILIINEKRCPKRKAATEKSAPIISPQKSKRVEKGSEQYQTPQSINGNAVQTPEQNITSVNKERASNQHDAFLNRHPVEQVCTEMAGNDNAHLLNTETLEFDTVDLHEELDRLLSLNLPWEDSE